MTAVLIPNKLTPLNFDQAAVALRNGYKAITGKLPSIAILALLIAQWAGETGNGQYIHNYNFGNVKHSSADQYYQQFSGSEVINGVNTSMVMDFAAYLNADDGAKAYIAQLKKRPQWWAGLQTGNLDKFVAGLVAVPGQHYFTADVTAYKNLLAGRMTKTLAYAKKYGTTKWGIFTEVVLGLAVGAAGAYTVASISSSRRHGNS